MPESKTKIVYKNEFGQVKKEIMFASYKDILDAVQSVGNLKTLGYKLDTTEKNVVRLWRTYPGSNEKMPPNEFKPNNLVGKKFTSPLENISDYIASSLMRSYFFTTELSYEKVDELVSSGIISSPIAAWFLAGSAASKYDSGSKNTAIIHSYYRKGEVLDWFERTKDRSKYKTVYEAAER